jgi:ElaB/YqjD/DUF883 family membrane-anchored ribosome-binding protein
MLLFRTAPANGRGIGYRPAGPANCTRGTAMIHRQMQDKEETFESGRRFAGEALERANERARELREGMHDVAQRGLDSVSASAAAAQRHLNQYMHATGRYVAEQPVKSALIAAAIGAAVAGLVIALRHQRRRPTTFY